MANSIYCLRLDLLSMIGGSAQDVKLIMDFLRAYLPHCSRIYNIMGGISLCGHTAWRIASLAPGRFHGFAIVVCSPKLTSLLFSRLRIQTGLPDINTLGYRKLSELMNSQQKRMWPWTLDKLVHEGDRVVAESFSARVPAMNWCQKSTQWVATREDSKNITVFVQGNTGHSCTKEMVSLLAGWFPRLVTCFSLIITLQGSDDGAGSVFLERQ